jgi:hypothetical protein
VGTAGVVPANIEGPLIRVTSSKLINLIGSSEAPAAPGENEIIVASLEELRAAPLNNKRLLALRNGLPGVDPVSKVGNREALLDRLWSTLESLPDPQAPRATKQSAEIAMLCRPEGATVDEVRAATGWQPHTVRGVFSGALKKEARSCDSRNQGGTRSSISRCRGQRLMAIPRHKKAFQESGAPSAVRMPPPAVRLRTAHRRSLTVVVN